MTVAICSNEHDLVWVFDDRVPHKWFSNPSTPVGTYCSIAAAFVGDPLKVVYLQETESEKILVADPKWVGILTYLGVEVGNTHGQSAILSEYPDFVSPYASLIKLAASDFIQESKLSDFNVEIFIIKAWIQYSLKPSQVKTAIRYAKKIDKSCEGDADFFLKLDSIYESVKNIETLHLSKELERINDEMNSNAQSAKKLISETNQMTDDLRTMADEFLEGLDLS
jgi:methyl-accepting chemotaxis protein